MASYFIQSPSLMGVTANMVPVSTLDVFKNDGNKLLHVKNGSGASITVTVNDIGSIRPEDGTNVNPNITITVPAGAERYLGPFHVRRFNDDFGRVAVNYSAIAEVTAEVLSVSREGNGFGIDEAVMLQEDGFPFLLEDGSGYYLLEE